MLKCLLFTASTLKIKGGQLKPQSSYNFNVFVNSKVNKYVFERANQVVKITENVHLLIDIHCLRNCQRSQYVKGDLLHLKAVSTSSQLSRDTLYKWIYNEQIISEKEHLVYSTENLFAEIKIEVSVEDGIRQGKCMLRLKENLPPKEGSCAITPLAGEAFITDFHIKCENYNDSDVPLSYEYLTMEQFPLQRTNDGDIFIKLPKTSELNIKICDQFEACCEKKIKVEVRNLEKPQDLEKFVRHEEEGLKNLLFKGDVLTAMILLKSLTPYITEMEHVAVVIEEIKNFRFVTLLQVEQLLTVLSNLVENLLPLDWLKAGVLKGLLEKLQQGFENIRKDKEIWSFTKKAYEKSSKDFMKMINLFGHTWQNIPPVQTEFFPVILASDPLKENYQNLPNFDVNIVLQLENWLKCSHLLENCHENLAIGGQIIYRPLEYVYELENKNFYLKVYALNYSTRQTVDLNTFSIAIDAAALNELRNEFHTQMILIHTVAFKNNLFWWYPSATAINAPVFQLKLLPGIKKSLNYMKFFKHPFEFQLKIKNDVTNSKEIIPGMIRNHLHMPLYSLELEPNAMLIVTFKSPEKPLKILVKFDHIPTSLEILKSNNEVKVTEMENQNFIFINPFNRKTNSYIAILLTKPTENISYKFYIERRECLFWDFTLKDPAWSSQGCKPKIVLPLTDEMTCICHHLSTFTGKSYAGSIQENLKAYVLLENVSLNWWLLLFYFHLLLAFLLMLIINFVIFKNHTEFLPHRLNSNDRIVKEIHILTGTQFNAGSTANITLELITQKESFSLKIMQDPYKSFLQTSCLCKLRLTAKDLGKPLKLRISNDQNGRYPSWYCQKIIVINMQTSEKQTFLINRWIKQQTVEVLPISLQTLKFRESFLNHLFVFYLNWFQFQPLWGCWQYQNLNRLERCCISLSQFMVCVCLVACFFGPTTMETYELERIRYSSFNFNVLQLFRLSAICYLLGFITKLLFLFSFWLLDVLIAKQRQTDKQLL